MQDIMLSSAQWQQIQLISWLEELKSKTEMMIYHNQYLLLGQEGVLCSAETLPDLWNKVQNNQFLTGNAKDSQVVLPLYFQSNLIQSSTRGKA